MDQDRENPLVSVVIPSYNRSAKLLAAVNSVLEQTWKELEVLIVDDGSTDDTKEVVNRIEDKRVKYVYQKNSGACVARNTGIENASGEYIAFHDSDDTWRKDKLEKQMDILLAGKADIVFCKLVKHFNDGSEELKPGYATEGLMDPVVNLFGIGTQTIVGKSEVFKEFGFDSSFPRFQEFEMLYRAVQKYSIYCIDEGLVDYYVGEDSISSNPSKLLSACEIMTEKHPEMASKYPEMGRRMAENLLEAAILFKGRKEEEKKCIALAKKCTGNTKLRLKGFLIKTGIYSLLRK